MTTESTHQGSIEGRSEVELLVDTFYIKVRKDSLLGPIFNRHIAADQWPGHLSKLADFWETNLFGIPKFKGSPTQKHIGVDVAAHHTIDQTHFGRWIQLWYETIDELFVGELATKAKLSARKMATGQFLTIWQHRPDEHKKWSDI